MSWQTYSRTTSAAGLMSTSDKTMLNKWSNYSATYVQNTTNINASNCIRLYSIGRIGIVSTIASCPLKSAISSGQWLEIANVASAGINMNQVSSAAMVGSKIVPGRITAQGSVQVYVSSQAAGDSVHFTIPYVLADN